MIKRKSKEVISPDQELLIKNIVTLSNSGLSSLDAELFKEIKSICKKSEANVLKAYSVILRELKKKHSDVRFSSFQMLAELFKKSHVFRNYVINDLVAIMELTAETNPLKKLPPPKSRAKQLKELAISTVFQWKIDHGVSYKQLVLCYNFLEKCKHVDFSGLLRQRAAEEERRQILLQETEQKKKEILEKAEEDLVVLEPDLINTTNSVKNCLELLFPSPDDFFLPEEETASTFTSDDIGSKFDMRNFGLTKSYNLTITFDPMKKVKIKKTNENSTIIENLSDNIQLAKKRHLPAINRLLNIFKPYCNDLGRIEHVVNLKESLEKSLKKCNELNIEGVCSDDSDDNDSDFEEVVKDGYEPSVIEAIAQPSTSKSGVETHRLKKSDHSSSLAKTEMALPSTSPQKCNEDELVKAINNTRSSSKEESLALKRIRNESDVQEPSGSGESNRKKRLLAVAPKLPFDIDLYHWEDDKLEAPTLVSNQVDSHRFWGTGNAEERNEISDPNGVAALRTRVIEFVGDFDPVKWACRVPLLSGKLCPRRDRVRCPFHGEIVPRDENGICARPDDEERHKSDDSKSEKEEVEPVPDWQDPELLAQLKAATGIDLKMPEKKKKGEKRKKCKKKRIKRKKGQPSQAVLENIKKRNFPGVANIFSRRNAVQRRLSKKLFNRAAMKRVAESLNKLERRRHHDKYADQFNYT